MNQKVPTQGKGMYPNLKEMQAIEHGGNASMSTLKIDEFYTVGGDTIGENSSKINKPDIDLDLGYAKKHRENRCNDHQDNETRR